MKDRQLETMAMTITPAQTSAIIEMKYPDLSEGTPIPEAKLCTPPPTRLRRKRQDTPHLSKRMKRVEHFNQMADRSLTICYPPLYSKDDRNQEEDAFVPYVSPLKVDRMSSFLRVRALTTPPKKSKRVSRSLFDSAKRLRVHHTYYNTLGLKHKILRLCGATKSPYGNRYMSIQR